MKETDIAAGVIRWLRDLKWETYQEVSPRGGKRADIVAVMNGRTWVIETKTTFSFDVIKQALWWKPYANWVSLAVPYGRGSSGHGLQEKVLKVFDLGLITWSDHGDGVHEELAPVLQRKLASPMLLKHIHEHGHHLKDQEGGMSGGGYWTPFKHTCHHLADYVAAHQGCSLKDAMLNIQHHYKRSSTATTMMSVNIKSGFVPGITWVTEGRKKVLRWEPK